MIIKKLWENQKIRFLFVGGINTSLSYGIYFILSYIGVWYILANTIGVLISTINSYFWNKYFVFKTVKKSFKEIIKFVFVYIIQYIFGIIFLFFFVDILNLNKYISGALGIVFCAIISYVGHKYFTYKKII